MDNTELIHLWKMQDAKIERALKVNQSLLKELMAQKAKSFRQSLKRFKTTGIISFILYLLLLGGGLFYAISHYSTAWNYFIISVSAIALINIKGLSDYIQHLIRASHINYDGHVVEIQQQLSRLQLSIFNHERIMFLQFPFFTTFYLSDKWFPQHTATGYVIFQFALTGAFIYLSYWLYKNHKPENSNRKWYRKLSGPDAESVAKAIEFYKETEDFKQE